MPTTVYMFIKKKSFGFDNELGNKLVALSKVPPIS